MSEKSTVYIGLKLADGSFYSIFEESYRGSKRLLLTTVHDNQKSVQIDIYKGLDKEVFEDAYIGSLVIENLKPAKKGAAEIELVIGIDSSGNLNAQAKDPASGEQQALSVSLESLVQHASYDIPDFDIDKGPAVTVAEEPIEETIAGEPYPVSDEDRRRGGAAPEKKKSRLPLVLLIVLGVILLLAAAGAVIYFFFPSIPRQLGILPADGLPSEDTAVAPSPSPQASPSPSPSASPAAAETVSPTVETVEAPSPSPEAKASPELKEPEVKTSGKGVWYKVKWGDTLWDLSRQYYRDPFQYMKIANAPENQIPNPDLIFANTRIFIPDK